LLFGIFLFIIFSSSCNSHFEKDNNEITAQKIKYFNHSFDVVTIDPSKTEIQIFLADKNNQKYRSLKKLKEVIEKESNELLFAMNGGMYLKDGSPQGLFIENGTTIKTLDTISGGYGNFYLQPNGIFYLNKKNSVVCTTAAYLKTNPKPQYATQSGPMLVIDNQLHPIFKEGSQHLNIRNGVGINSRGKVIFAISNDKVNLYDFAMFFKEKLACKNALYLDGFVGRAYIPKIKRKQLDGNFGVIVGVIQKH